MIRRASPEKVAGGGGGGGGGGGLQQFSLQKVLLKDNLPHNTCQIYVKPHSKSTEMTLEYHILDEKALE